MGLDVGLLIEEQVKDGWVPATRLSHLFEKSKEPIRVVKVVWWSARSEVNSIFHGPDALFPFHAGCPSDPSSETCQYLDRNRSLDLMGWIPLTDLALGTWPSRQIQVGGYVEPEHAHFLMDGKQVAPSIRVDDLDEIAFYLEYAIRYDHGRYPSVNSRWPTRSDLVLVHWMIPLIEYASDPWHQGLEKLIDLPNPENYRILSTTC